MVAESRWPPIYDFDQLTNTIREIVASGPAAKRLYDPMAQVSFFQGDVIKLESELPFIGANGAAQVQDAPPFWAVLGNTCDFDKDDIPFTQVVPVWDLGPDKDIPEPMLITFRRYRYYTQFYFPRGMKRLTAACLLPTFCDPSRSTKALSRGQQSWRGSVAQVGFYFTRVLFDS